MGINLTNFLSSKTKNRKMSEFQDLDHIDGVSIATTCANLYNNNRDDLAMFYFRDGANHSTVYTQSKIISENFFGQKQVVDEVLSCVLCSDHALIEGVPGLGKTLLFQLLSKYLNLKSNRIQCTPDLMPSDILGTEILNNNKEGFSFIKGPIFCQLLMIDEVNRASPRTQSAFLQAMEEKEISISGKNFSLPRPFLVLATQNPIEQEGTYNLPEAQLDRFLMKIKINYPNEETEKQIYSSKRIILELIDKFS